MIIYLITPVNDNFLQKDSLYSIISYLQFRGVKYYLSIIKESFKKHLTYENRQIKSGACNQWGYKWNVGNLLCRKEEDYSKDCFRNDDIFQLAYLVNFLLYNCTHTVFKLYTYISCNVTVWFIHRNSRSLFLFFFLIFRLRFDILTWGIKVYSWQCRKKYQWISISAMLASFISRKN